MPLSESKESPPIKVDDNPTLINESLLKLYIEPLPVSDDTCGTMLVPPDMLYPYVEPANIHT